MDTWKLQDAKARFSELVDRALADGPQLVTRHGAKAVVVLAYDTYAQGAPVEDFKSFLLSSRGVADLDLTRDKHPARADAFEIPA